MSQRQNCSLYFNDSASRNRTRRRQRLLAGAASTAALLGIASLVQAGDISWSDGTGAYEVGANWVGGVVPGDADIAYIDNGGVATLSTFNGSVLGQQLGSAAGKTGTLIQNGGHLDTTLPLTIGNGTTAAGGSGTYVMNGGSLTVPDAFVGEFGTGTFIMNNGTITSAAHFRIGHNEGGNGTMIMSGGVVTMPGFFLVGEFSPAGSPVFTTGTFLLSGGTMTCNNYNLGQHPQARGEVRQSGGWARGINLVIGEISRQDNRYDLSGGVLRVENTGSSGTVFAGSSAGVGGLYVSGNGDARIDGHIFAGNGTTSLGTFQMSGGTVALGLNKPGGGFLVAGEFGTATVNVSGGVFSSDFAQFGRRFNATSRGQVTQTGGSMTVRRSITLGSLSANDNFWDMSAGTLNVTNDLGQGTLNETQSGLHVARFSVDPGSGSITTGYSKGRLTISGTAAVNIAGGLYNSTGFHRVGNGTSTTDADLPGGAGTIQMLGGTLNAASFLNGSANNAGSFNNGGATANYIQSGGSAAVGPVTGTGTVAVSGGTMTVASIQQAGVAVNGGLIKTLPNGTSTATSRIGNLTFGGGRYDLADNDLIVTNGTYSAIAGAVFSARTGGTWNGPGLTSSSAKSAAQHNTTLGVLTGQEFHNYNGGTATFDGFAVANSDVLVKYTWYGDSDFNGVVDFDDYVHTDAGFNNSRTGWANGDFDLNGTVDFDDYVLIDLGFNTQNGTLRRAQSYVDGSDRSKHGMSDPALQEVVRHFHEFGQDYAGHFLSAVPEPTTTTLALLGVSVAMSQARRCRRRA